MATDGVIEILDSVPADVANRLEKYGKAICKASASGIKSMFDIAGNLRLAHDELANHGNGGFVKWVESRCGFSARTARRYLRVASVFGAEDWDRLSQSFTSEALYLLASETTPAGAVAAALASAKSGERINLESAKELVSEYTVDEAIPDAVDDEQQWSPSSCMVALRSEVARWAKLCPAKETKELSRTLRELADQVDGGNWNEC